VTREQVYGRRPVREALRGPREVLELWATERAVKGEPWLRATTQPRVLAKLERDISEAAGTRDHQGVLAWCEPYRYADAYELARAEKPLLAVLDRVTDPRNLGAVVRSVGAFGGHGVVLPQRRSAGMTAVAWRTSAGVAARLPVARATNLTRTLREFATAGYMIAGLDADASVSLDEFDLANDPLVLVVGSEGKGLSRLVKETCDVTVSIPMAGPVESLNASVATGVVLAEVARRRRQAR
jgi:23S rRNA (guanosine2251-2'-O)-methyltransferase